MRVVVVVVGAMQAQMRTWQPLTPSKMRKTLQPSQQAESVRAAGGKSVSKKVWVDCRCHMHLPLLIDRCRRQLVAHRLRGMDVAKRGLSSVPIERRWGRWVGSAHGSRAVKRKGVIHKRRRDPFVNK